MDAVRRKGLTLYADKQEAKRLDRNVKKAERQRGRRLALKAVTAFRASGSKNSCHAQPPQREAGKL